MDNLFHSSPEEPYPGTAGRNGFSTRAAHDDSRGGLPKLGPTALSPRLEDYVEIFGGLRSSRALSVPVLYLPATSDESHVSFDIPSSDFDYCQVFGGGSCLDFAVPFEKMSSHQSSEGDDSSEPAWAPAYSGYLTDESDPSSCSENNQGVSDAESFQLIEDTAKCNISYHKACPRSKGDVLNGITHVSQLQAVSGYSFVANEIPSLVKQGDSNRPFYGAGMDIYVDLTEGEWFTKSMSCRSSSTFDIIDDGIKDFATNSYSSSRMNRTFVTVSDISLRTQPSGLPPPLRPPPPSRPPPILAVQKGDSDGTNSEFKASQRSSFECLEDEGFSLFFDMKKDSIPSAAALNDAIEEAREELMNAKRATERKKRGGQHFPEKHLSGVISRDEVRKINKDYVECNDIEDKSEHRDCEKIVNRLKSFTWEEKRNAQRTLDSMNRKQNDDAGAYFMEKCQSKDHGPSQISQKMERVIKRKKSRMESKPVKVPILSPLELDLDKVTVMERTKWQDNASKIMAEMKAKEEVNANLLKENEVCSERGENTGSSKTTKSSCSQIVKEHKVSGVEELWMWPQTNGVSEELLDEVNNNRRSESPAEVQVNEIQLEAGNKLKDGREDLKKGVDADHIKEWIYEETFKTNEYEAVDVQVVGQGPDNVPKEELVLEDSHLMQKEPHDRKGTEKNYDRTEMKQILGGDLVYDKHVKGSKEIAQWKEIESRLRAVLGKEESEKGKKLHCQREQNGRSQDMVFKKKPNARRLKETIYQGYNENTFKDDDKGEDRKKGLLGVCKIETIVMNSDETWKREKTSQQANERESAKTRIERLSIEEGVERESIESTEWNESDIKNAGNHEKVRVQKKTYEQISRYENDRKHNLTEMSNARGWQFELHPNKITKATQIVPGKFYEGLWGEAGTKLDVGHQDNESKFETVNKKKIMAEERWNRAGSHSFLDRVTVPTETEDRKIQNEDKKINSQMACCPEKMDGFTLGQGEGIANVQEGQFLDKEASKDKFIMKQVTTNFLEKLRNENLFDVSDSIHNLQDRAHKISCQIPDGNVKKHRGTPRKEIKEKELIREKEQETDFLKMMEEEREKEKDWMSLDRSNSNACETAVSNTCERASMDRATDSTQKVEMPEAQQGLDVTFTGAKEKNIAIKLSMEMRIKAQHTEVEKEIEEGRQCALKKELAENIAFETQEPVRRSASDKFIAPYRDSEIRQNNSFSGFQFEGLGTSKELTHSYSSVYDGLEGESPLRCKARLERYRRIAERAGKALAEKKMRDIFSQREQAERSRLAEALDAEVKRWSSGKEKNLRALLSTLQYILWPESGWQPIPLTGLVTSVAVKKAYRKAALYVHPDKLQQRRANIQQKYICEKVFDLLKEAWNKFITEEH